MVIKKLFLLSIAMFLSTSLQAQVLPFQSFTIQDGLPSNQVGVLFQDSRGYLWIGTSEGISLFDGTTFTNYSVNEGLAFNTMNKIIESKSSPGTILVATNGGGISKWKNGKFQTIKLGESQRANSVNSVYEDSKGKIWCSSDSALLCYDNVEFASITSGIPEHSFGNIIELENGQLWVSGEDTMFLISPACEILQKVVLSLPDESFIRCVATDDNNLWVAATDGSFFEIKNNQITCRRNFGLGPIQFILVDEEQYLWLGAAQCLLKIRRDELQTGVPILYTKEQGLPENFMTAALRDNENELWFGTYSKGITRIVDRSISFFPLHGIELISNNQTAAVDSFNHLWVVAKKGIWEFRFNNQQIWQSTFHPFSNTSDSRYLTSVLIDKHNQLWVTFSNGDIEWYSINYSNQTKVSLRLMNSLSAGGIFPSAIPLATLIDKQGLLWCSYHHLGVAVIEPGTNQLKKIFTPQDGLPNNSIRALLEDSKGNVWLGDYSSGLGVIPSSLFEHDSIKTFTTNNGLPDNFIRTIYDDDFGNIWIGTRFGGIGILKYNQSNKTISVKKIITSKDRLLSNAVWGFAQNEPNRIWFGTHSGMQFMSLDNSPSIGSYGDLVGSQIYGCGFTRNSYLWAVKQEGIFFYDGTKEILDTTRYPVQLKQLIINGTKQLPQSNLELSYNQNNISFEYVSVSLKHGQTMRYSYRLLGVEDSWHQPTSQREVTYANLKPGFYQFQTKAMTSSGVESEVTILCTLSIIPPFWQRWWFIVLIFVATVSLLYLMYKYRVSRLLEIERLRVRIASDLHDDVGSTLTKISVHSELIQSIDDKEEMNISLRKIGEMSRELVTTMSDIVWSIDARNETIGNLLDRMEEFAHSVLSPKEIFLDFQTHGLPITKKLSVDVRQNIYFIFKEAVNNIVKYSEATSVSIKLMNNESVFIMTIEDNGKGLEGKRSGTGHGLRNMRMRAERIQGTIEIHSGHGTKVTLKTYSL
ncbi:MAG: hypothetical protein HY960_16055 [Ignavibacteriae bacterium]|nr:hypothetical protein [Ignavibacteriota bacterium]